LEKYDFIYLLIEVKVYPAIPRIEELFLLKCGIDRENFGEMNNAGRNKTQPITSSYS
jgi:hypothetical protein